MADPTLDPAPPASPPPSAPPTAPGSGLPQNVAAALACIFLIIGGVIFLIVDRSNRFVRFHAWQSIYLGIIILAVSLVFKIGRLIFGDIPFVGGLFVWIFGIVHLLISIVWFIAYAVTIVMALSNKEWEVPYLGAVVRRQLGPRLG
jgi:uncharacterized membrane protein